MANRSLDLKFRSSQWLAPQRTMNEIELTTSEETDRWLQERQRSGNWFDIAETDEIPADLEGWFRTILHIFQIAFAPEIRSRLSLGQLDEDFFLGAAQLILPDDGERMVRLNDEVRAVGLVRVNRAVRKGDAVLLSDMRQLEGLDLGEDELDAGHFTLFWTGDGWFASFDFRAGRAKSAGMLDAAYQFLEAAQSAAEKGHARACVDNLFSACELASKARLILHRSPAAKSKRHGSVKSAINNWGRLGNVDKNFLQLFNRMSKDRSPARYDPGSPTELPSDSDMQLVRREIEQLQQAVAQRTKTADESPK